MYVHEYKKLRLNHTKGQLVKILNHVCTIRKCIEGSYFLF